MGGWYVSTNDGSEDYLNYPMRALLMWLMQDMDGCVRFDAAILSPACDPANICRVCQYADGYTFDGHGFRAAMQKGLEFLNSHPGWQGPKWGKWSEGSDNRQVMREVLADLAGLSGERIYFHDALEMDLGICPEGAPYYRNPKNLIEVPAYLHNMWVRWRYRIRNK